ncbi:DNA methyltransferase [Chloroflexota bacterium]
MKIEEFYKSVQKRDDWSFSHLSRKETAESTHAYHHYPAKFIPQLARSIIENYTKEGDYIWDTFCGSGTLNVEAFRKKRHSIGTDINPTALLITRAKTSPIEPDVIMTYKTNLLSKIEKYPVGTKDFYVAEGALNGNINELEKWFSNESLLMLAHIIWCIRREDSSNQLRDFAHCAFSGILKRSSYWLASSVKSQIDPNKKPGNPLKYFKYQLNFMAKINDTFYHENIYNSTEVKVTTHNAKDSPPPDITKVDCIITSPPYVVSYDYSDIFRLTTYTLFAQSDYDQFRRRFVGTPLKRNTTSPTKANENCHAIIDTISNVGIKRTLTEYYNDMSIYYDNIYNNIKTGGYLIMVVGDTKLRGVEIPNTYLLSTIAQEKKWLLDDTFMREIPVKILPTTRDISTGRFSNRINGNCADRYDREYILVFRRPE